MRTFSTVAFGVFVSVAAFGQSSQPSFEAADVHSTPLGTALPLRVFPYGGRYEIRNATMVDLIRKAYTVDAYKILGGPGWIEYDRFDIIAKVPPNTSPDSVKSMLQALLSDRFKLQIHNDTKPVSGLALTLGNSKPKMKESDGSREPECHRQNVPYTTLISLSCHSMTTEGFAAQLKTLTGDYVTNSVVDSTGLKGAWDFDLKFTSYERLSGSDGISLADAIDKQLGLKLEEQKLPTDVLIVDDVNRRPTDNSPDVDAMLPPAAPPEFEVASIKPAVIDASRMPQAIGVLPGGRVHLWAVYLKLLVSVAWNLNPAEEIPGAPKWFDSAVFEIIAKASPSLIPEDGAVSLQELAPALRALLKDRFKMEVHFEDRPVTAYTLVLARPNLNKTDPSTRTGCRNSIRGGMVATPFGILPPTRLVTCQNITMSQVAEQFQIFAPNSIRYPVVDGTGLDGGWDFSFMFDPPIVRPINWTVLSDDEPAGAIFDGLEKQLGLKLEAQKRPYPVMVIDHIEQKPTDN